MIESLENYMPYLLEPQFSPFLMVVSAIILLIIGHVVRLSSGVIFTMASACLFLGCVFLLSVDLPIGRSFAAGIYFDGISFMGLLFIMPASLLVILLAGFKEASEDHKTTSLLLLLISLLGAMVTLISSNWMVLFVSIQCMSIPIYGLLAYNTDDKLSVSSSIRYLVLSGIAMSFMLFGIVMLYAATGTMDFFMQYQKIMEFEPATLGLLVLGLAFILVGIGFKLGLVPFHFWAPEVYQGSSLFLIGYLVIVVKGVMIFFLLRNFSLLFVVEDSAMTAAITGMAILSMWVGNGLMLVEKNFLRFLAFLSIGHLGILLIPMLANNNLGAQAICLDLVAFGVAIFIILGSLKTFIKSSPACAIDDFRGLARLYPWQALILIIALISMAGVPLTAGFIGKYAILMAGTEANMWHLIAHMVLSSVIGIFALARIVVIMLQTPVAPVKEISLATPLLGKGLLFMGALSLLVFGIFPEPWLAFVLSQVN